MILAKDSQSADYSQITVQFAFFDFSATLLRK